MNVREGFTIALASLIANPLRSFLTLLGIIIGIVAIISVVAVINGLNLYVEEKIVTLGPTSFEVNRFGIITNRKQFFEALRRNPELRISDAEAVRDLAALPEAVGVKVSGGTDARYGRSVLRGLSLRGISPEILMIEPYEVAQGRAISLEENVRAARVAFVGHDVATKLFGVLDPVGRSIKLWGRSHEVVGVGAPQGSVFGQSRDSYVLIPINTFRKTFGMRDSVSIVVRVRRPEDVEPAMDEVRAILRSRHHLRWHEPDDFGFISSEAINSLWRDLSRTIFQIALFIVGISLVVGGIVIMNIMLVSVIERTREIGIRKAVGARHKDILRQFLIESAVLSGTGGVIGILGGYAASRLVAAYSPLPAVFPIWAPIVAIAVSSGVGIFFGLWPAMKAARLNPIEALRSE